MEDFKVCKKPLKTLIILISWLSDLLESLFVKIHWLLLIEVQSHIGSIWGGFVSDRNGGFQGVHKNIKNLAKLDNLALGDASWRPVLLKSIGFY